MKQLRDLSISLKVSIVVGIPLVFAGLLGMISVTNINHMLLTRDWVEHTHEVLINTSEIEKLLIDMETGQRGFLITGKENFLEPYKKAESRLTSTIVKTMELVADNPTQVKRFESVYSLGRQWLEQGGKPGIILRREVAVDTKDSIGPTMLDVVALIEQETGKQLMDQLRFELQQIKAVELGLLALRKKESENSAARVISFVIFGTLFVIALSLLLAFLIIRSMMRQISFSISGVERISRADYSGSITILSDDEIGKLSKAVNQMLVVLKDTAVMAKRIAAGDYKVMVDVKGPQDELGQALEQMTRALVENKHSLAQEKMRLSEEIWIQSSYVAVVDKLQGISDLQIFSNTLLQLVSTTVGAQVGVYYEAVEEEGEHVLKLISTYAYKQRESLTDRLVFGQGIIGQCALDRKTVLLSKVPKDYFCISSGLGGALATDILVFPIEFEGKLLAVIEIGTLGKIDHREQMLVKLLQVNLGVILNNIQSRFRTSELLRFSESQSNELQAQKEQLELINNTLNDQKQRLQKSETQLKIQSEELSSSNLELRDKQVLLEEQKLRVETAKNEVEVKAAELAQASQYKSEFLANMSHELRTPLNSLLILARLLKDNTDGNLSTTQEEYARVIFESGQDLLDIINDILDLSKIEAGMLDVTIELVDLADLSQNIVTQFRHMAEAKGIEFTVDIEEELETVIQTDSKRIEQILRNLLSNAFKFTEQGAVSVRFHHISPDTNLQFNNLNSESGIAISVTDTGVGISADKQQAIFDAFQQEDGSTSRQYGGTGLGLAISREFTRLLRGEIQLNSIKGKGSIFTVYLPKHWDRVPLLGEFNGATIIDAGANIKVATDRSQLHANHAELQPEGIVPPFLQGISTQQTKTLQGKKVLVLDGDMRNAFTLSTLLQELGSEVILAADGQRVFDVLDRKECIDLIIMDSKGLAEDGLEVIDNIQASNQYRKVPIIVLSDFDTAADRQNFLDAGANCLSKPVDIDRFVSLMNESLQRVNL